jgi:nitrous oxidase accessory protein
MVSWKKAVPILIISILIVSVAMSQLLNEEATSSRTIIVPDDYPTVQGAIDNAESGDTVLVRSGVYNQSINVNKSISLIGQDAKTTVLTVPTIYGADYGYILVPPPPVIAVEIDADNVKISGFTIRKDNSLGVGIKSNGTSNQITDVFMDSIGGGIILQGSNQTVYQNYIANALGGGVQCSGSYNQIMDNQMINDGFSFSLSGQFNTVSENQVVDSSIYLGDSSLVYNNSISGSYINLWNSNSNIIYKNTMEKSILTVGGRAGGMGPASNNLFAANTMEQASAVAWAILVAYGSNNVFYGNIIANNGGYGLAVGGIDVQVDDNLFYYNVFANNSKNFGTNWGVIGSNSFDNGTVGNYWDDYLTKYPTARMVDNSGVGNTPYSVYGTVSDNYPLMVPFDVASVSIQLPDWSNVSKPTLPTIEDDLFSPNANPTGSELSWLVNAPMMLLAVSTTVAVIEVGLFVYWKKRKHNNEPKIS